MDKKWFLYRLDYKDELYHRTLLRDFDDLKNAIDEQRKLSGMNTEVSNIRSDEPHKIYNL